MTSPLIPSLIDEQLADIERSLAVIGAGLPRDVPVSKLPPKLVAAIKAGRISVRPRP
jgi:hypothetical protein